MKRLLLLLLAACSSQHAPAPAPKPTQVTAPAPSPAPVAVKKGSVATKSFKSAALGVDKDYVIYLPAGYDEQPAKRWPVFYYLHGLGGKETDWVSGGHLDNAADTLGLQAIVVMPDGDDGFYADSAEPIDYDACMKDGTGLFLPAYESKHSTCVRKRSYETYIVKDLIGEIDTKYRTIATRDGRAIAGLSMGGFGALELGMRHPALFAAAASHSGVDALLYAGPFPYVAGKVQLLKDPKEWGVGAGEIGVWIRGLFGTDLATWKAYDPASLAEKLEPGKPALYLDCGTEDGFLLNNGAQYLHDILVARKIEHAFFLGPGQHDFRFWIPRLPESLKFLREHTAKPT
ncbi:MAG TPA: alpha/beta hydrolase family protein [Kofleriaceae bacterium]|nr:alpha/beta hydrolase family protein [Kofleriaceae bacterium]